MRQKQRIFRYLRLSTVAGAAAVAALDSGLFNAAPFVPPSISNVAFADETRPRDYEAKLRDENMGSILALLDVPEGESGEFYRERLQDLQNACAGVLSFEAACYNLVRYRDEKNLPQWRRAEPNSLENQVYVAARALYERLFDAPDLEPQIRDRYFAEYLRESYLLYGNASDEVARQDWRDFCAARLALEETREPFPLARVLALHDEIERADARVEKLADCPRLVAFIDDLLADANLDSIESLESLGEIFTRLRAQERPAEEDVAFYRERWQELRSIVSPRGIQINVSTLLVGPFLAEKLAFAEELDPIERFEAFQIYVGSVSADVLNGPNDRRARVERLTALLEEETKRKAEHPADAARVPYLRERLFHARYGVFLKPIGEQETTPLSEEDRAELERFAADALELVDDGPLPWSFRRTWGATVCVFIRDFADQIDVKFATQLRKDVLARLRNSANETDRALCAEMAAAVRDAEIIGSTPTVEGRFIADGKPLDWAAYRGAPVLVEIFRDQPGREFPWRNSPAFESEAFFNDCVDAGLQVVRYGAASFEDARRHYEATRPKQPEYYRAIYVDRKSPVVGPLEGREGDADWAVRLGFSSFAERAWILFDADGRVVAVSPRPNVKYSPNAPTLQEALETLYPNARKLFDDKR